MPDWVSGTAIAVILVAVVTGAITFARWTGRADEKFKKLENFMSEIRTDIKHIFQKLPPQIVAGHSPRKLTEYGEDLSNKLHAQDWAERIAPTVLTKVIEKEPFEIHNFCKEFVQTLSVEEHPDVFERSYENGITDENMKIVLAIVLRDELLKQTRSQA